MADEAPYLHPESGYRSPRWFPNSIYAPRRSTDEEN